MIKRVNMEHTMQNAMASTKTIEYNKSSNTDTSLFYNVIVSNSTAQYLRNIL